MRLRLLILPLLFLLLPGNLLALNSRLPRESYNWLQVVSSAGNGDRDDFAVVFFEVPDTITSTLYFAVNDPGCDGVHPDSGTGGTTDFFLYGGSGALSDPDSRIVNYAGQESKALTGNLLDSFNKGNVNEGWVYFQGVAPSQGEHIGNKYYFKIVVRANASVGKNAFQLDVSYANSGTPTGSDDIQTFAYDWPLCLRASNTWDIYPFVPEGATGTIRFHNWDFDGTESLAAYDATDSLVGNPTVSGNNTEASSSYSLAGQTNSTWRLRITEDGGGIAENTSELWFSLVSTGEILRAYSSPVTPPSPDHVALSHDDGQAISNGSDTETIVLQVVDSDGTPLPYARDIYVSVDGSGQITESNTGAVGAANTVVTTDSSGLGYVKISNTVAETVNVTILTDGTNGSDDFGSGSDDSTTVQFATNLPSEISSSGNKTFSLGDGTTLLPQINITDSSVAANITAANDIYLRLSSGLQAEFDTSVTTVSLGGTGSGNVSTTVSYPAADTVLLSVTGDFSAGDTLAINDLKLMNFTGESSGNLEMSTDGGTSYESTDDKVLSVLDTNPPTISQTETVDLDSDGFIDAVKITFSKNIKDSSVVSGDFSVTGASNLSFAANTNGDATNNNIIYIKFDDGTLDTSARPDISYTAGGLTDLAGNSMVSAGPYTPDDKTVPTIVTSNLAADNSYLDITFSEGVYGDSGASTAITTGDFSLTFAQNGGNATAASLDSVTTTGGAALSGGETTIRFQLTVTGEPIGSETINITVAGAGQVYDGEGNSMAAGQSTGDVSLLVTSSGPPQISQVRFADRDANGKIDELVLVFDKNILDSSIAADLTGAFTLEVLSGGDTATNLAVDGSQTSQDGYDPGTANDNKLTLLFNDTDLPVETGAPAGLSFVSPGNFLTSFAGDPLAGFTSMTSDKWSDQAPPRLVSATANGTGGVSLLFSESLVSQAVTADNIDTWFALTNTEGDSHSWLNGSGNFTSATWEASSQAAVDTETDQLTIILDLSGTPPTISVGDIITPENGALADSAGNGILAETVTLGGQLADATVAWTYSIEVSDEKIDLSAEERLNITITALNAGRDPVSVNHEIALLFESAEDEAAPVALRGLPSTLTLSNGKLILRGIYTSGPVTGRLRARQVPAADATTDSTQAVTFFDEAPEVEFGLFFKETRVRGNVFSPRSGGVAKMDLKAPRSGILRVQVLDVRGRVVKDLFRQNMTKNQKTTVTWNGRNSGGEILGRGLYLVRISAGGSVTYKKILIK